MKLPPGWTEDEEKEFQAWAVENKITPDDHFALYDYRDLFRKQKLTGAEKPEAKASSRDRIAEQVGNAIGVPAPTRKVIMNAMRDKYLPLKNFDENSSVGIGTNSPIGLYYRKRF